ncbi:MAG: BatA domain-containing protein [Hyphomicrobiales bacterium]
MEFNNPGFLWGLFAIAIPVIFHLFNLRPYKKVYFSNTRFLFDLKKEQKKYSRIRNLLLLVVRMLIIFSIIMAFAQPYFPENGKRTYKTSLVSIYIDNSFSMESSYGVGTCFEKAKQLAYETMKTYSDADRFNIITNDFLSEHQRWYNKEELLKYLENISLSPSFKNLKQVSSRQSDLFHIDNESKHIAIWISDFQNSAFESNELSFDDNVELLLMPVQSEEVDNISVDSIWLNSPVIHKNSNIQAKVKLTNHSNKDQVKIPVNLKVDNLLKSIVTVDLKSKSSEIVDLNFNLNRDGNISGDVFIDDFPVNFDDHLYFTFKTKDLSKVLELYEGASSPFIKAIFENDSSIVFKSLRYDKVNYSDLNRYDFIILNGLNSVSDGMISVIDTLLNTSKTVCLIPSATKGIEELSQVKGVVGLNKVVESKLNVNGVNRNSVLFEDVFEKMPKNINVPFVSKYYNVQSNELKSSEVILSFENGTPFLWLNKSRKGNLFQLSTPLNEEWTSFVKHSLFVPVFYRMAFLNEADNPLSLVIGEDHSFYVERQNLGKDGILEMKLEEETFIPAQKRIGQNIKITTSNNLDKAGIYSIRQKGDDIEVGKQAYIYSRKESNLTKKNKNEIESYLNSEGVKYRFIDVYDNSTIHKDIVKAEDPNSLWIIFVILAILFLITESTLLYFKK